MNLFRIVIFFAFFSYGFQVSAQTTRYLPEFTFMTLKGTEFSRSDLKRENNLHTVVIYSAPECNRCAEYMSFFKKEASKYPYAQVVWVSSENEPEKVRTFFQQYLGTVSMPYLHVLTDPQNQFPALFGSDEKPIIFVFNPAGEVVQVYRSSDWE